VTFSAKDFLEHGVERRGRKRHVGALLAAQLRGGAFGDGKREQQTIKIADPIES